MQITLILGAGFSKCASLPTQNEFPDYFLSNELSEFDDKLLFFISEGFTSEKIADKLFVSKHTIDAHRVKLMEILNLKTGHDLHKYAILYTESKKI